MAWIPHSITEFGEIEVDDADPKRKRARMYQRRRRRRRDDGVCVPFEAVEEGADQDLRVRCAALNFRANKQAANFRIFNDDFSTALATKRVRVQQRIAGNWTNIDLPAVNYRVITKPNKGPDYAAWRWVFRVDGIARLEIEFEQELGASKWSYELTNLQATTERFRIVQRFQLLQAASSRIDIFRRDSIQSAPYHAGYKFAFTGSEAINVDWSDMGADFGSFAADPGFGVGDGVTITSAAFDLAAGALRLIDPTYTADAGWSAGASAADSSWSTGTDFGGANAPGRYAGNELRMVLRFPISSVPSGATVDSVTLEWYVEFVADTTGGFLGRIGPHAGDGRTDPQTESPFSTSWANADTASDYYVNGLTSIQSTGAKSQSLGSAACTDVASARSASVTNFSIAFNAHNMGASGDCYSITASYNNSTTSHQPNLVIVYTEASGGAATKAAYYRRKRANP